MLRLEKTKEHNMSSNPKIEDALREAIISRPDVILDDSGVMKALIGANERAMGANIVDLRGIAMDRMETRLDRLENTHRSVIAAAYENVAGTQQIHRAVLKIMEPATLDVFLQDLGGEVADILRVEAVKLVLEAKQSDVNPALRDHSDVLTIADPGFVESYLAQNRQGTPRQVTLRQIQRGSEFIHGKMAAQIQSEACLMLDFGAGKLPGLLVLGSQDHNMFGAQQGTDLLVFFAGVLERTLRRWQS